LWELLWNPPALTPPHPLFLYDIMFVLALLAAPLIISSSWYTIYILLISYINSRLHARAYQDIRRYVHSVRAVGQLVVASAKLARVEAGFLERFSACCGEAVRKVWFLPLLARSVGAESKQRRLARSIRVYPNIFFLSEVRGFYRSLRLTQRNREALQKLFLTVGEVDALLSVASYRTSLDYFCEPEFTGEQGFELEDAYHPLLAELVPNSIDLSVRGILISGGSMSGKSTFLRTVGLNVLLAQSIVTCHARVYKACPLRLITFMDRVESVLEGRGYFLDEALRVRAAIEAIGQAPTTLVIFDELFRGVSSAERITAASRVLGYLSKRDAFVLVATHDLELTKLLGDVYANFHFSQGGGESGFQFDYKLKEGPAVVGNAMALLRHLGYPEDITM